jgi:hypothetical protein
VDGWEFWSNVALFLALKVSNLAATGTIGDRLVGGDRLAGGAQRLVRWHNRLGGRSRTGETEYLAQVAADAQRRLRGIPSDVDPRCYAVLRAVAPFYRLGHVDSDPAPIPLVVAHWEDQETVAEEHRRAAAMRDAEYPTVQRDDGGVVKCGDGIMVVFRNGFTASTFDDATLTRLVLAAHRWCCRVDLGYVSDPFHESWDGESPRTVGVRLIITPREPGACDTFARHPSLADLRTAARWPTRRTLEGP